MTFREKLQKEHPDMVGRSYVGGCVGCPVSYGYEEQRPCDCNRQKINCNDCWDREIPDSSDNTISQAQANWGEIHKIIEDAVEKCDRSVSIYFNPEVGMSVSVYPWPDAEELYDMYQKGRITANDFRSKMGLPRVKNAEQFMKRDFLNKEMTIPSDNDILEKIRTFLNGKDGFAIPSCASASDFEDAFSTEHLVDVTTSWQFDRLGGIRLYCLGVGYSRDDLNPYEQYLVERSEMLEAELKTNKR